MGRTPDRHPGALNEWKIVLSSVDDDGIAVTDPSEAGGVTYHDGSFAMKDGSGVFNPRIAGDPAGSDTQIQYNNGGVFGGCATLYWDDVNNRLGVGAISPSCILDIESSESTTGIEINNTATDGDPYLSFQLSGVSKFTMGVDDGDSDKFKIGTTAIGTGTILTINSGGNIGIGADSSSSYKTYIYTSSLVGLYCENESTTNTPVIWSENLASTGTALSFYSRVYSTGSNSCAGEFRAEGISGSTYGIAVTNSSSSSTSRGIDVAANGGVAGYFRSTSGYGIIVSSGYVGIGSTAPSTRLEVGADDTVNEVITVKSKLSTGLYLQADTDNDGSELGSPWIKLSQDGGSVNATFSTTQANGADGSGASVTDAVANDTLIGALNNFPLKFFTNAAVRMAISSGGYVGIGVTPGSTYKLDVNGLLRTGPILVSATAGAGEGGQIDLAGEGSNSTCSIDNYSSQFRFMVGSSPIVAMRISSDGKTAIGLGGSSAAYQLHVASSSNHAIYSTSSAGSGVYGATSNEVSDSSGVFGTTAVDSAYYTHGVRGYNDKTNSSGSGVYGQSAGSGVGVRGVCGSSGSSHGVLGRISHTTAGRAGVYGECAGSSNGTYGVYGNAVANTSAIGVYGKAVDGRGVVAEGHASGGSSGRAPLRVVPQTALPTTASNGDIAIVGSNMYFYGTDGWYAVTRTAV